MRVAREIWAVLASLLTFAATGAFAAPGGSPAAVPTGEEAANQLSFPVLFPGAPLGTIPAGVGMGEYSLGGAYYLGDGINPPCLPGSDGCSTDLPFRIFVQKDPANLWQAFSGSGLGTITLSNLDVSDNLESVPWKDRSVVRVEFVPFAATDFTGFEMAHISGLGVDEVWGLKAANSEPPVADAYSYGYATAYADCMGITLTKLDAQAGAIEDLPTGTYSWDGSAWQGAYFNKTLEATAEINVKGKVIYGYNWMVRRMTGIDSKVGWWRLTFHESGCGALIPFDYTAEGFGLFDPLAAPEEEVAAEAEDEGGQFPNYPRVPLYDATDRIVYIDVYIRSSTGSGGGGGGGGKGPPATRR